MADLLSRLGRFLRELKRRNVYRVAVTYAVVAFVVVEAADLLFPRLLLPDWSVRLVIGLALLGFPIALVLAWAFEMTPEGVRRTPAAEISEESFEPAGGRRARSRLAVKALVGLGLVAAAVAGGWYLTGGGGEGAEISEEAVAVLPFEVSGSGAETWRDGMVTMLSTGLDGAGGLRAIPDRTVFAAWEGRGRTDEGASTDEAVSVAREVGARYAVVGSAVALGDELRLTANVRSTSDGRRLGRAQVRGSPDSVTALVDSLTHRVLGVLLEESGAALPSVDLASLTTSSLPALKAYLAGERAYRNGDYEAAVDRYRAAIAEDSSFALAYERLAVSLVWIGGAEEPAFHQAYERSDRLPVRERRLLRAMDAWETRIFPMQAADSLRALTEDYPDDPRSWYYLAEVLMHGSVPGGWPEAERAFLRALELDAGVASYHYHPVELATALHHDSALAARRIEAHPPDPRKKRYRTLWELNFGSPSQREEARARLDTLPPLPGRWAAYALDHPRDKALQTQVLRRLPPRELTGADMDRLLARNLLHRGRVERALALLGRAAPTDEERSIWACLLAGSSSLGYPVPDSVLRAHLEPSSLPDDASTGWLRCAGVYLVEAGRDDELPPLFGRIRQAAGREMEGGGPAEARAEAVIADLRGYRAWQADSLGRAARRWSDAKPSNWEWGAVWRGDLYRARGEAGRAEDWYVAAWPHPVAHERLGQLYREMGRPEDAAAAYRRFVAAWEEADPELQPRVEEARERLRELTAGERAAGG